MLLTLLAAGMQPQPPTAHLLSGDCQRACACALGALTARPAACLRAACTMLVTKYSWSRRLPCARCAISVPAIQAKRP